ncbi:SMI1/KNR4 family protein [bacterium]|nr:SMI1/KNR4 family protein [bacterium]
MSGEKGKKKRKSANAPTPDFSPALGSGHDADPFASFVSVLKEKDPELSNLETPARKEEIDAAESELGAAFPPLFRRFLLRWNGGTAHDTCIYGVGTGDDFDLVELNERGRSDDLPKHLIGFAATIQGEIYCFDTSKKEKSGDSPVVLLDADGGKHYEAASSFADFLEKLPGLEQALADARGPQPMSVEEWEAFLQREREKLRRLSKTPARDMPMPDPETSRADLGGKIPVDPRHLKPKGGGS